MNKLNPTVNIIATFAAESIRDAIVSAIHARGIQATVTLLPYHQMGPSIVGGGDLNVILIRWNDWIHGREPAPEIVFQPGERVFSKLPRHKLPNGMEIAHQNKSETQFLYEEIFVDNVYLKHGITLPEDSCIFDVGANIGLFSVFAHQQCQGARLYAFEPIPPVFEILKANAAFYGVHASLFNCGLSNESKEAPLTYYPNYSIMSGFHANAQEEKVILEMALGHMLSSNPKLARHASLNTYIDGVLNKRLESKTLIAQLRTLSSVIREHRIKRIDLLKIDVEKSELSVLLGIAEEDWKIIRQIAMEIHDSKGDVIKEITHLLEAKGFNLTSDADKSLAPAGVYMLYAARPPAEETPSTEEPDFTKEYADITLKIKQLLAFLKSADSTTQYLLCICPASTFHQARVCFFQELENRIMSELKPVSGVRVLRLPEIPVPSSASPDFLSTIGQLIATQLKRG